MRVDADHNLLQYCGRIDWDDIKAPVLVYAASFVKIRFTGSSLSVVLANHRSCYINAIGYFLDGIQGRFDLVENDRPHTYVIARDLPMGEHECLLFKRMDSCHTISFMGFEIDDQAEVLPLSPLPERRIEVFGDSVSCGEVSEAVDYVGQSDPENHNGIFSNSYYSYSWITARKLGALLHDTSQGGIPLLDNTGWFHAPVYPGMESCYDKIEYNPECGPVKPWDFSKYIPQVVILAVGQNDSNPKDYMAEDYEGDQAKHWRAEYRSFIEKLMKHYPKAYFVCATTILGHHANWDRAIDDVVKEMNHPRVSHFLYSKNGCGTCGHIRIPEAYEMAEELSAYIQTLGIDW